MKLVFEADVGLTRDDRKLLSSMVEKLQKRFKVVVAIDEREFRGGVISLVFTTLDANESTLHARLDAIGEFCEASVLGRITQEHAVVDDVETLLLDTE